MKFCALSLGLLLLAPHGPAFLQRRELSLPNHCQATLGKWQNDLVLAYSSAPDEVCVIDSIGQVRLKGPVRLTGYEGVRIEDITASKDGRIALEGISAKGRFIAWLGMDGQVHQIVDTGQQRRIITFAADGTLWAYHTAIFRDSTQGFSLTQYDQDGAHRRRLSFPNRSAEMSAASLGASLGDRIWALEDRIGIYRIGKAWMEVSYDGQVLGQWEDNARIARSLAVTADGTVFATPRTDFDLLKMKVPMVWLDKLTGAWRPAVGGIRGGTIIGADGSDLVLANASAKIIWIRRE